MLPTTLFPSYASFPAITASGEELALFPLLANLILQVLILSSLPPFPPIIISCLAKMAIGMWQFYGDRCGRGLRHALCVLKLIDEQELHLFFSCL